MSDWISKRKILEWIVFGLGFLVGLGLLSFLFVPDTSGTTLYVVFGNGEHAVIEAKNYSEAESFCYDLNGVIFPTCGGEAATCNTKLKLGGD